MSSASSRSGCLLAANSLARLGDGIREVELAAMVQHLAFLELLGRVGAQQEDQQPVGARHGAALRLFPEPRHAALARSAVALHEFGIGLPAPRSDAVHTGLLRRLVIARTALDIGEEHF